MGNYCAYHVKGVTVRDAEVGDSLAIQEVNDPWGGDGRWIIDANDPSTVVCLDHGGGCTVNITDQPPNQKRLPSTQAHFYCIDNSFEGDRFQFADGSSIRLVDLPPNIKMEVIAIGPIVDEVRVPAVPAYTERSEIPLHV